MRKTVIYISEHDHKTVPTNSLCNWLGGTWSEPNVWLRNNSFFGPLEKERSYPYARKGNFGADTALC